MSSKLSYANSSRAKRSLENDKLIHAGKEIIFNPEDLNPQKKTPQLGKQILYMYICMGNRG